MNGALGVKPDILDCLANLSSDEVFTPPKVVNAMLDMLPQELFRSPKTKFLDPFTKSGVFLREIAKRLDKGLEKAMPDKDERIRHIFAEQVYGIAITQLTALFSRRSLYCNKDVNNKRSTVRNVFRSEGGNIGYHPCKHMWKNGSCTICGASKKALSESAEVENYAYPFLHDEVFMKQAQELGFDVVIGNPPYQMNIGVEKENYAIAIYDKFVEQAKKLNPHWLVMIIPARWYAGGRNLDSFRDSMLGDKHISYIADYPNAEDCFPGVDISGGVCYFMWNRTHVGNCRVDVCDSTGCHSSLTRPLLESGCDTFIRFNAAIPILRKIRKLNEPSFSTLVSPQTPFGFVSSFDDYSETPFKGSVELHCVNGIGYVRKSQIRKGMSLVDDYKVYIAKSYGERGAYPYFFLAKPFLGKRNSCCTQSYLCIGTFKTEREAKNVITYIRTRFFRFCIMLKRNTQDAMRGVYEFVPVQDFSKPWTDAELYKKYKLTKDEIAFIESMIRPME